MAKSTSGTGLPGLPNSSQFKVNYYTTKPQAQQPNKDIVTITTAQKSTPLEQERKLAPIFNKESINKSTTPIKQSTLKTQPQVSEDVNLSDERGSNEQKADNNPEKPYALPKSKGMLAEIPSRDLPKSVYNRDANPKTMLYSTPAKVDPRSKDKVQSPSTESQNVIIERPEEQLQEPGYITKTGVVRLDASKTKEIITPHQNNIPTESEKEGFFDVLAGANQMINIAANFTQTLQGGYQNNHQPYNPYSQQGMYHNGMHNNSNWPNNLTSQTYNQALQNQNSPSFAQHAGNYQKMPSPHLANPITTHKDIPLFESEFPTENLKPKTQTEVAKKAGKIKTGEDEQNPRAYAPLNTEPDRNYKKPLTTPKSPDKGLVVRALQLFGACGSPKKDKNSPTKQQKYQYQESTIQPTKIDSPTKSSSASATKKMPVSSFI